MGAEVTVARTTRQVQMNTRIDENLKEVGDAVLRRLGYTPSAAVRGLWRFAVERQDDPAAVRAVLGGEKDDGIGERVRVLAAQRERYAQCVAELGIADAHEDLLPWDVLRDDWYEERLARAGGA